MWIDPVHHDFLSFGFAATLSGRIAACSGSVVSAAFGHGFVDPTALEAPVPGRKDPHGKNLNC